MSPSDAADCTYWPDNGSVLLPLIREIADKMKPHHDIDSIHEAVRETYTPHPTTCADLMEAAAQPEANRVHTTGSQRDDRAGKGRFDLICPHFMLAFAQCHERGCDKYEHRNMELGQPLSWFFDSAERHIQQAKAGEDMGHHLMAAAWNLAWAWSTRHRVHLGLLPDELLDMPSPHLAQPDSPRPELPG